MSTSIYASLLLALLGLSSGGANAQTSAAQESVQAPHPIGQPTTTLPRYIPGGFDLPNGWRITPAGKAIDTLEDLTLKMVTSPDGKIVIASHSGYLPHGIVVIDTKTQKEIQHIELKTTWLGMTWSPDGHTLYVSQ